MMEALLQLDYATFRWINQVWTHPALDTLLPWCRERWFWSPLYLYIMVYLYQSLDRAFFVRVLIGLVLMIGISDTVSSTLIKKNVQRVRPCNDEYLRPAALLRIENCGSGFSFTSSHATNHFAVAIFFGFIFRKMGKRRVLPALTTWAATIAYAQVYVGVHYPLDVLCGALLGTLIGWCMAFWTLKWDPA
jgi:membrane-associated phospholipid phosphatase